MDVILQPLHDSRRESSKPIDESAAKPNDFKHDDSESHTPIVHVQPKANPTITDANDFTDELISRDSSNDFVELDPPGDIN